MLATAGAATTILSPDYAAIGVATVGGVIGGYLSVSIIPDFSVETRRTIAVKWSTATLTSIATTPFLFQRLSNHTIDSAGKVVEAVLPATAEAMLALSTTVAFVAWVTLLTCQVLWQKYIKRKLERLEPDEHEQGGP